MTHGHGSTQVGSTDGHVIHWARYYDALVQVIALGQEHHLRRQTIALAQLQAGQRVLDVGCGTGTLAIAAAQSQPGLTVQSIDPAGAMIERAKHKAAAAGVEVGFEVGVIHLHRPDLHHRHAYAQCIRSPSAVSHQERER